MCTCIHCGKNFIPNPRIKNQRYCSDIPCQRARRAKWAREKMAKDPDYRDNKRSSQEKWFKRHRGYYKKYRATHPEYVNRNRLLQLRRNSMRRKNKMSKMIAKIDALTGGLFSRKGELFKLIPQGYGMIAKMNSCVVKLIPYKGLGSHG
jgi:hypothetical protein